MFRILLATIMLSMINLMALGQNPELRTANSSISNNTLTFDVQIRASTGSFKLGGEYTTGRGAGPGSTSIIDMVIQPWAENPTNSGEMGFQSVSWATNISNNYNVATAEGDLGASQGYLDLTLTGKSGGTLQTVSTTYITLATVTLELASGTTTSNSGSVTLDASYTDIYDEGNSIITNGTFDNSQTTNVTLPIVLQKFDITKLHSSILATWTTTLEENNEGFEIQRSYDGHDFAPIGWLNGQGNSISPIDYSFTDHSIELNFSGTIFYRLKQIDFNGEFEYSPVRSIKIENEAAITWFPNPAQENIVVNTNETAIIEVYDMAGKTVLTTNTLESNSIDVSRIEMGTYLMIIKNMNGEVISQDKLHIK